MIEVLISGRSQGETDLKKEGDIICAKLAGAPWGNKEKGAVIQWEDDTLEAELVALQQAGEPHPIIIHPYAEYEKIKVGTPGEQVVMVNRSSIVVDMAALDKATVDRLKSREVDLPPLTRDAITTKTREAESQGGIELPKRPIPGGRR